MEAKAIARYIRIAPRKARLVVDQIRGKNVIDAENILRFSERGASEVVFKVVHSAAANANDLYGLRPENLYVKEAYVDQGPTLKRFRPRAKGSASPVRRRTSHITIVVASREEA